MRDHRKLRAFELADQLAILVYRATATFPKEEMFGLTAQLRRGAVSVASNIVEGCGRESPTDYLRFLDIAFGAAQELEYQLSLAERLGLFGQNVEASNQVQSLASETTKVLNGLIRALRSK